MTRRNKSKYQGGSQDSNGSGSDGQHSSQGSPQEDSVTTEAIMSKLANAKEIEKSLESMAADLKANPKRKSDDEKTQALRLKLCSVLSDVILLDCMLADSSDAVNRLWKSCFYGRINDMRSRIMKEKSRAKKRGAAGASNEADQAKKKAKSLEEQLKRFLQEAIQLYKYLVDRYVKELMPLSQSQSQASTASDRQQEEQRSHVVVSSLYKMNIHLGDLYRYSTSYDEAMQCYTISAKLAPGTGNPYNQMAVVAQQQSQQDAHSQTASALYYYARSLMASRQPFETSRSNLVRLFESNRRWMEEHSRDDDAHSRGIVNVGLAGGDKAGMSKKAQREWMQKEKTAVTRKALSRFVDLQWAFFRGVSLDGYDADGRIDLDGLARKMNAMHETCTNIIGGASLGESLLCKMIAVLAFSTLGASNGGKLMDAESGFDAKRAKDPRWNEGIVMTNQALAFSFVLRFCAVLAKDVDGLIAKKLASDSVRLGAIRCMSPLLLGFRYVMAMYEGNEWFHGRPFFPNAIGEAGSALDSSAVHRICRDSHAEFWRSIASLANHFDALPKKNDFAQKVDLDDLADMKDLEEFQGYVPFASFLDKSNESSISAQSSKKTKYVSADEAVYAFAEAKPAGGGKGGEAETWSKINIFLAIADGKTSGDDKDKDGQYFLSRNPETKEREFVPADITEDIEKAQEQHTTSPEQSLKSNDMDVEDTKTEAEDAVPLKMAYSEKGMALLTPAALLAGAGGAEQPALNVPLNSEAEKPPMLAPPFGSMLAPTDAKPPTNPIPSAAGGIESLIEKSLLPTVQPEPPKAPLPPPPGFQVQPQPERQLVPPLPTTTGISLADFASPIPAPQNIQAAPGVMPQAGHRETYPASNMFETLNPFAQQAPLSFNNNLMAPSHASSVLNQPPPGLMSVTQGINLQQPTSKGLDPTLDFLLSGAQTSHEHASSNSFNLPSMMESGDQSESIMNFLFDSNDNSRGQSLYAGQQQPKTKNPFAT